jgi:hypothetical protein
MASRGLPPQAYQTFQIHAPKETHTVPATCEEVECAQYAHGWAIKVDLGTDLGQKQAYYIKYHSGRAYKEVDNRDGLVTLEFRSGQKCFQEHRRKLEKDPLFRVKGGDSRGNPLRVPMRTHKKPEFWVEEFAENQQKIADAVKEG